MCQRVMETWHHRAVQYFTGRDGVEEWGKDRYGFKTKPLPWGGHPLTHGSIIPDDIVIEALKSYLAKVAKHTSPDCWGFDELVALSEDRLKAIPAEVWPVGLLTKVKAEQKRIKQREAEWARIEAFEASLGTELLYEYRQRRNFYTKTEQPMPDEATLVEEAKREIKLREERVAREHEIRLKAWRAKWGETFGAAPEREMPF
jgi:hypothetical protein